MKDDSLKTERGARCAMPPSTILQWLQHCGRDAGGRRCELLYAWTYSTPVALFIPLSGTA